MSRAQKLLLVVAALIVGVVVVYVDTRVQRGKETATGSGVVSAVEARLAMAKKSKKLALVSQACPRMSCECAAVAGRQELDVDAHLEVLGVLAAASQMCPANAANAALHAEAVARLGDVDRSKSEAGQVLAKDPNSPYGLYALSLAAYRAGNLEEAMASAQRAIAAGRGATANLLAGLIAYNLGNFDVASSQFRSVLDSEPDDIEALFNLALVAQRQGRYTEAREGYLNVTRVDPSYKNARYNLAILAHSIGATDEANHHLAKFESMAQGDERVQKLKLLLATPPEQAPARATPPLSAAVGAAPAPAAPAVPSAR